MGSKRKREPWDYRQYYPSHASSKNRRKSIADYRRCSAQQRHIFQHNSASSPLLRLPAEIRNEIYGYVLSDQVIHISVRECPIDDDACSWSHAEYNRHPKPRNRILDPKRRFFLKFTHTICTLPFDEEDQAHTRATLRNHTPQPNSTQQEETTSYRIRHKPCYRALARLKGNWIRDGEHVTVSPYFTQASRPGLCVALLQTCRQIYSECRDLVYTSNTFAFHEGNTLDLFLSKCLTSAQRSLISSIQLDGWNDEYYDPGRRVRPTTLQLLTGLRSMRVAVTNAYLHHNLLSLDFWKGPDSTPLGYRIEDSKAQKNENRGEVVKVTVDRLACGSVEVVQLERFVKRNVEAALGFY